MRFRPHPLPRFGILLLTGALLTSLQAWRPDFSASDYLGLAVFVLPGIALAVRWIGFAGVECTDDTIIVRGMLWSRRIPRHAIERISRDYVFVRWHTPGGHAILTPVTALWSKPNPAEFVTEYNHAVLKKIDAWHREAQVPGQADLSPRIRVQ